MEKKRELWDLYDREGKRTGEIFERGFGTYGNIPQGRYHLVSDILVRNKDGRYLLCKRHMGKDVYPGFWEASAGGSAKVGELPEECARRELKEETGLEADQLELINVVFREPSHSLIYCYVADVDADPDSVILQEGETVDYKWVDAAGLIEYSTSDVAIKTSVERYADFYNALKISLMDTKVPGLKRGTVAVELHDPEWERVAKATIEKLKRLLGSVALDIQHIGSTAIKNIVAKPIIDIVVGVWDFDGILKLNPVLEENGFIFRGQDVPNQYLYVCGDADSRTHHIHVVLCYSIYWNNYVNMRDYLNSHEEDAREYSELKKRLAAEYPEDRNTYTEKKSALINEILKKAAAWRNSLNHSLLKSTQNTRTLLTGSYRYIRSDVPGSLTDDEVRWLYQNGITTIVDLRSEGEFLRKPCRLEHEEGFTYHHMPVTGDGAVPDSPEEVPASYVSMIDDQMERIIHTIMNADSNVLYFCNAGKDRTGVVSAIILYRLGFDDQTIIEDYMKTKENLMDILMAYVREHPEVDHFTVIPKEENITAVLAYLKSEHF